MALVMTKMFKIALPDGSVKEMPEGSTPADVAAAIGPGLAKAALAAQVDGEVRDIMRPFEGDASLALITSRDEADALELVRHDFAHVLAEAVQSLFPGTQITFGPATDDGFYYDFAPAPGRGAFTEEDLPAIEEEMRRIIAADKPLIREVWTRDQVRDFFEKQGEAFKAEWVMELPEGETITMYRTGEGEAAWIDLCRGPHLASTGKLDPQCVQADARLGRLLARRSRRTRCSSRIYGTGWLNKKQLDAHLVRLEEAAKRDHRKIGQEMDLFHLQAEAHGSVFWHPKGYIIWRQLEAYMRRRLDAAGYDEVKTPQLMDAQPVGAVAATGASIRENMFVVPDEVPVDRGRQAGALGRRRPDGAEADELPGARPDLQAGHHQLPRPAAPPRRVRLLPPQRAARRAARHHAGAPVHAGRRAISSAARTSWSTRSRRSATCSTASTATSASTDYAIKLALRPDQRFGSDEDMGPGRSRSARGRRSRRAATARIWLGGAAGRRRLLRAQARIPSDRRDRPDLAVSARIQLDTVLPERLDAIYVGEDGEKHRPVMLHRAILGTFERFIGILIEHHAGKFPLWLAPVQAVVATIVSDADDYAGEVAAKLAAAGIRVETDLRNEKINYKVREHSLAKVPLLLVVGKREADEGTVALRRLGSEEHQKMMSLDEVVAMIRDEAVPPDLIR